jgi:hypothetical protein
MKNKIHEIFHSTNARLDFLLIIPQYNNAISQELTKKWFPGHYVNIRHLNGPVNEEGRNLVKDNPYIMGYKIHIVWNEIEVEKDQYDFSVIHDIINLAESDGKKLMIHLQDRVFNREENPYLPDYLLTPEYEGGWYHSTKSQDSYPKLWLPAISGKME